MVSLKLTDIVCDHDFNCRGRVFPEGCTELAASIKEVGLLNPITVMSIGEGKYQVVAGHRRYTAVQSLGWDTIDAIVADITKEQAMKVNLQENLGRRDLTPTQEMRSIVRIYGPQPDIKQVVKDLGKSKNWVMNRLAIRTLPEEVQHDIDTGLLNATDIGLLITVPYDERWSLAAHLKAAHAQGKSTLHVKKKIGKTFKPVTKTKLMQSIAVLMENDKEPSVWDLFSWLLGDVSSEEFFGLPLDTLKEYGILE